MQTSILRELEKMSNKTVVSKEKKPLSKAAKITIGTFLVIGLELCAIATAVKVVEYRQNNTTPEYQSLKDQISAQTQQLANLERLSVTVSTVSQHVSSNANALNLISDNLNALKEEVGNNQIRTIKNELETTSHRLQSLEEERSNESLVLSVALMIKENVLYHRSYVEEADILAELTANQPNISSDIAIISDYKDKEIANNEELAKAYQKIAKDFTFGTDITPTPAEEESSLKKGLNILKDSANHINLDRIIVLKKQKKTDEQIKLLNKLSTLVNGYKFAEALQYIQDNKEFGKITLPAFAQWQQEVRNTIAFNQALSHIINLQLRALRQDVKNDMLKMPKAEKTPIGATEEPEAVEETVSTEE